MQLNRLEDIFSLTRDKSKESADEYFWTDVSNSCSAVTYSEQQRSCIESVGCTGDSSK